ncbi:hypothetical protein [Streptomyces chartreusis]|uniref:hypothetical protein n=1 Tax=Streptomyces chartreusis TaxID=1969 RepID=UPI003802DC94
MSTILAGERPTGRRVPNAGSRLLAAAFEKHADALLAYIRGHNEVPVTDPYGVEDLASEVWLEFTRNLDRVDERVLDLSWLRLAANGVIRKAAKAAAAEPAVVSIAFTGSQLSLAVGSELGAEDEYVLAPMASKPDSADEQERLAEAMEVSARRDQHLALPTGAIGQSASSVPAVVVDEYAALSGDAKAEADAVVRGVLA